MADSRYSVNDTVLYGAQLCKITEKTKMNFSGNPMDYFVLKPVYSETDTIYVPLGNETLMNKMRRILSSEEIYKLIRAMPRTSAFWIEDETKRKEQYKEVLMHGNRSELIQMIKALYNHRKDRESQGKKLHVSDERFLKDAEHMLYDEFALVLHIRQEQVLPFILEQIELEDKKHNV